MNLNDLLVREDIDPEHVIVTVARLSVVGRAALSPALPTPPGSPGQRSCGPLPNPRATRY
jgi:hypothetical protein